MEDTDVWEHFDKCDEEYGEKKAKCRICDKIYCYITTIHNLKRHLTKHDINIPPTKSLSKRPKFELGRGYNTFLWNFFTRTNLQEKRAKCNICDKSLSYKSTIGNLRNHLKNIHLESYEKMVAIMDAEDETMEYEVLEEGDEDQSDDDTVKTSDDAWSYFERDGARARCAVCRAVVPRALSDLRDHLRWHHPKLLGEDSDQQEEDGEHYTEVIYLEDAPGKGEELRARTKRRRADYEPKVRRTSTPREKESKEDRKKTAEEAEIESFGAYVTCLLKSLPKDVCSAVQRDIINIIMSAKLKPDDSQSVVIDGTPVILKAVSQNKSFIVIENSDKESSDKNSDIGKINSYVKIGNSEKVEVTENDASVV